MSDNYLVYRTVSIVCFFCLFGILCILCLTLNRAFGNTLLIMKSQKSICLLTASCAAGYPIASERSSVQDAIPSLTQTIEVLNLLALCEI